MTTATYSLRHYLASFEFFNWLVMVQADGATEIAFDVRDPKLKNFTRESVEERFRSILEPGPALAGLPSRLGADSGGPRPAPIDLIPWWNSGRRFRRLRTVKPPVACDYTVTIRNNRDGARARDSDRDAWLKFADAIGATVIDDYFVEPIHLHDRVALYAGAKMNFGVCNGPIHLISLTPYPVAMFLNTEAARNAQVRTGTPRGGKYPWMTGDQHVVWQGDTYDDLRRWHDAWERSSEAGART